jgi:glycosyltransferase involved in cell wall biosynthesis
MAYLARLADVAGLPHEALYIDPDRKLRRILPKRIGIVVGVTRAMVRIRSAKRGGCTLVHVNTSLYPRIAWRDAPVVAAARRAGLPVLLQVHGGRLANLQSASRLTRRLWKGMFETAAAIGVFPGPQLAEFERTSQVHHLRTLRNVVPRSSAPPPIPSPTARFLFLGSLTEAKGAGRLVDAFIELHERSVSDATLTIAGTGPLEARLRRAVDDAGLSERVRIVGYVTGERLRRILDDSDVFVLPSEAEGFPLSFLECAERGMACLVTRNSAVAELFANGDEIVVIPPDDVAALVETLGRVASDSQVRVRLGRAVQARVRAEYTIEAAAAEFRRMYLEIPASRETGGNP